MDQEALKATALNGCGPGVPVLHQHQLEVDSFKADLGVQLLVAAHQKIQDGVTWPKVGLQLPGFAPIGRNIDLAVVRPTVELPECGSFDGDPNDISHWANAGESRHHTAYF
jgi:hypothetical protein